MSGTPRKRARLAAMGGGVEPPKTGWRPARGSPTRRPQETPLPAGDGATDTAQIEQVIGGLTADDLMDDETHQAFEALRAQSLAFARQIMEMPLDVNNKHFAKILSVKQAIATSVFTVTTRVRPGDLRDRDDDGVGVLLAEVKARQGGAPSEPTVDDLLN